MQHKTTLRVSDSRPNVNRFDRFKIFSSPPAHKTQNEGTGTQSPFSFEKKKRDKRFSKLRPSRFILSMLPWICFFLKWILFVDDIFRARGSQDRMSSNTSEVSQMVFSMLEPVNLGIRGPARFSKVPVIFRARNQIFKSKYKE